MATPATGMSAEQYERIALAEPERRWELHHGRLREKPGMSVGHDWAQSRLYVELHRQVDPAAFWVQFAARLRWGSEHYLSPEVCVVPIALVEPTPARTRTLNAYAPPLPLVAEVWSPPTGEYDITAKVPIYQLRGDREIWRLHPFEQTLTAWRRQPDGTYTETMVQGDSVSPVALPGVTIALTALCA